MKKSILALSLAILTLGASAQSQNIVKLSAGWYSVNNPDDEDDSDGQSAGITLEYQHIGSRGFGFGVHCDNLDHDFDFIFTPSLLYRFQLPVCPRGINITALVGGFSTSITGGVMPTLQGSAELDVPLSDHWGIGANCRYLGVIGASISSFGASVVYSF